MNAFPPPSSAMGLRRAGARGAFSLMEGLIVMAIVGIIAILVYPALDSTRKKARDAKCVANLKVAGSLLSAYLADEGTYPGLFVTLKPGTSNPTRRWFEVLQIYAGLKPPSSLEVPEWLRCPARAPATGIGTLGYGYNFTGFGHMPDDGLGTWQKSGNSHMAKYWKVRPAQVEEPAKKLVIGDSLDDDAGEVWRTVYLYRGTNNRYHARRHHQGGHYLYADGHVGWLHVEDLWEQARRKQPDPFYPF